MKQPLSLRLSDEDAEKVRLSHERSIKELQAEVRRLSALVAGRGEWEEVDTKVLTSAATEVGFSNLRGNTDIEYKLCAFIVDDSAASSAIALRPNGSTTGVRGQILTGLGSTASAASQSVIIVGRTRADGEVAMFEGVFRARTGSIRPYLGIGTNQDETTPNIYAEVYAGHWTDTTTEVTSLLIVGPTNGFGKGSVFRLFRRAR